MNSPPDAENSYLVFEASPRKTPSVRRYPEFEPEVETIRCLYEI